MYNYTHTAMDPSAMDTSLEPLYLLQWSIDIKNMRTLSVSVFVCALQTTNYRMWPVTNESRTFL